METTIYVEQSRQGLGAGRLLYGALEHVLLAQNITNLNACIATSAAEDAFLTRGSKEFHRRLGYRFVGEFQQCGYKFHRWYNMVWMEKHIAPHRKKQPAVIPFPALGARLKDLLYPPL